MTSIMSRSQGRKSWSMIRSTPAAAKPPDGLARLVGRAGDPPLEALLDPGRFVLARRDRVGHGRQPGGHLRLVPPDQDAGHRRVRQRRRIAVDGDAGRVDGRERSRALAGPDELRLNSSA